MNVESNIEPKQTLLDIKSTLVDLAVKHPFWNDVFPETEGTLTVTASDFIRRMIPDETGKEPGEQFVQQREELRSEFYKNRGFTELNGNQQVQLRAVVESAVFLGEVLTRYGNEEIEFMGEYFKTNESNEIQRLYPNLGLYPEIYNPKRKKHVFNMLVRSCFRSLNSGESYDSSFWPFKVTRCFTETLLGNLNLELPQTEPYGNLIFH